MENSSNLSKFFTEIDLDFDQILYLFICNIQSNEEMIEIVYQIFARLQDVMEEKVKDYDIMIHQLYSIINEKSRLFMDENSELKMNQILLLLLSKKTYKPKIH